ncbi:hypothetical protein [Angustibacter aerolatus]
MADGPDVTDALGVLGNALEKVERARGRLYDFHQLTGAADLALSEAIDALREVGLTEQADRLDRELVGRNVVADRWTFQLVEDYDDNYYGVFRELEQWVRDSVGEPRRHAAEQRMKDERRSRGVTGHEAGPPSHPTGEAG